MRTAAARLALLPLASLALASAAAEGPAAPAAELQQDVDRICERVAALRGTPLKGKVVAEAQSAEEFKAFVLSQLDRDYPADEAKRKAEAFALLGLLPEGTDLRSALTRLTLAQALAYYNPVKDRFYMIQSGLPEPIRSFTFAHELEHALQDQACDLEKYLDSPKLTEDEEFARRSVAEGEANLVSMLWLLDFAGQRDISPDSEREIGMQLRAQYEILRRNDYRIGDQLGNLEKILGDAAKELVEKDRITAETPRFLVRTLTDAYTVGALFLQRVYAKGGWKAVDALYEKPPRSSEQILHPEKFTAGEPDEPRSLALPGAAEAADQDTLGEFEVEALVEEGLRAAGVEKQEARRRAEAASAGWDGDRYALGKDGVLRWVSAWDSEEEAKEFHDALRDVLAGRLGAEQEGARLNHTFFPGKDSAAAAVALRKDRVALAIGPKAAGGSLGPAAVEAAEKAEIRSEGK